MEEKKAYKILKVDFLTNSHFEDQLDGNIISEK
jgi:hypothetical protein